MARRRFFVDAIAGGRAELRGDDARHLSRVLRAEPGQLYEISDNRSVWLAEITEARPALVAFRAIEPIPVQVPAPRITLCAALVKFDRLEWMIEKTTELGAARILPVEAARSEHGLFEASRKRAERWVKIARESSQQCRRAFAPEILPAARFPQALAHEARYRYFLDEQTAPPLAAALPEEKLPDDQVAFLVGPEGGWTEAERAQAVAAGWMPVSLGPLILRAETAAMAALAVIGNAWLAARNEH